MLVRETDELISVLIYLIPINASNSTCTTRFSMYGENRSSRTPTRQVCIALYVGAALSLYIYIFVRETDPASSVLRQANNRLCTYCYTLTRANSRSRFSSLFSRISSSASPLSLRVCACVRTFPY